MDEPLPDPRRLARALRLGVEFRAHVHRELREFLRAHEDLRDLLEPMLSAAPEEPLLGIALAPSRAESDTEEPA